METNQPAQTGLTQPKEPTFDELSEMSGLFLSAKNYREGQRITVHLTTLDRLKQSEKYGSWQAVYNCTDAGQTRKIGISAKMASVLKTEYHVKDYNDLPNRDLTLLITKGTSALVFSVADLK